MAARLVLRCAGALRTDVARLERLDGLVGEYSNAVLLERVLRDEHLLPASAAGDVDAVLARLRCRAFALAAAASPESGCDDASYRWPVAPTSTIQVDQPWRTSMASGRLTPAALLEPHWRLLAVAFRAMLVQAAADLLEPWPLKIIFDDVLGENPVPSWLQP